MCIFAGGLHLSAGDIIRAHNFGPGDKGREQKRAKAGWEARGCEEGLWCDEGKISRSEDAVPLLKHGKDVHSDVGVRGFAQNGN